MAAKADPNAAKAAPKAAPAEEKKEVKEVHELAFYEGKGWGAPPAPNPSQHQSLFQ